MVESVLRLLLAAQQVNGVQTQPEDIAVALQLVDEWGRGFVAETDYRLEARTRTRAHDAHTHTDHTRTRSCTFNAVCFQRRVAPVLQDVESRGLLGPCVTALASVERCLLPHRRRGTLRGLLRR